MYARIIKQWQLVAVIPMLNEFSILMLVECYRILQNMFMRAINKF